MSFDNGLFCVLCFFLGENEFLTMSYFPFLFEKINIRNHFSHARLTKVSTVSFSANFEKELFFDISQPNCEFRQEKAMMMMREDAEGRCTYSLLKTFHRKKLRTGKSFSCNLKQTLLIKAGCDRMNEISSLKSLPTASSDGKVHSKEYFSARRVTLMVFI
jgi:hypothetical protein